MWTLSLTGLEPKFNPVNERLRVRVRVRVSKEMTYAHNFRKRPNQMYVIGIWGKSGQGKTAHGAEF